MDIRIVKKDCSVITSSQLENGIYEIVAPKECGDKELSDYLNLHVSEFGLIEKQQKNATKKFRDKVDKLIDKYKEEFKLKNSFKLRMLSKMNRMFESGVEIHGIETVASVSISSILQYVSEDLLEKIVRCAVYSVAVECEEKDNFQITMPISEIKVIQSEYTDAEKSIIDELKRNPIISL